MAKGVLLGRSLFVVFFAAILAAGCGGGGGSGGTDVKISTSNSSPTAPLKAGVFVAEITRQNSGTTDAAMLMLPSGQFAIVFTQNGLTFGELTVTPTVDGNGSPKFIVGGNATDYVKTSAGWGEREAVLSGTASSSQNASFIASPRDGSTSFTSTEVTLTRSNTLSDQPLSITELSNTYSMVRDGLTTAVTIGVDGVLSGDDGTGCRLDGQITIPPDTAISLFNVSYTATGCGPGSITGNGDFQGVGSFDADQSEILFAATDGDIAFLFLN